MDWTKFTASLIRAFWTFVFPMLGALVVWLTNSQNVQSVGIEDATIASAIAALLYGVKKFIWPDTKF